MKTIFNRLIGFFGIYILAALFTACPDMKNLPQIPQAQYGKALVSISVTDNAARTVFPQVTVASYKLLGGINGAPETVLTEFTTAGTSISLESGIWNFTLNAYNQSGEHILQGITRNQQIDLTRTNQVSFSLSALNSGTGAIQITLNFPESADITRITANNGSNTEEFTSISGGEFVYTKEDVDAGDYFISFGLYRGDILRTVVSELVLVRGNLISSKTITLIGEELNRIVTVTFDSNGGSSVPSQTVAYGDSVTRPIPDPTPPQSGATFIDWYSDSDLTVAYIFTTPVTDNITLFAKWVFPLTGTVTITGTAQVGQTLTANTTNLDGRGTISYQWNRDGTPIPGANSSTYTVQSADVGSDITVTVTRTGTSGSVTSASVNVINLVGFGIVTFNSNGGSNVPSQSVASGSTATRPTPDPTSKLIFENWYSNPGLTTIYNFSTPVTQNITLYAKWTRQVTFTTAETRTINLSGLSGNSVYLVRVNTSTTQANANQTGSVQSISPSSLSDDIEPPLPVDEPRRYIHHPGAAAFNANPPPIPPESPFMPLADFIPPQVGATRSFQVEPYVDSGSFVSKQATLRATGTYGNIWVMNGETGITDAQARALSDNFDIIYPAETNILGFEYGGGPGGNGGRDGDPKVQILVYDLVTRTGSASGVVGYFWGKDYYNQTGSNMAEIFYIDSTFTRSKPSLIYLTLAHEFQHMIHFNQKFVKNGRSSAAWYNETLSMMTEDVMANTLGITTTNADHPVREHIPIFLAGYTGVGFSEWPSSPYPYSKGYTFGAYLLRNYGGADVLRRILANNTVNDTSITAALNEIETGMTYVKAVSRFGEAMIFSGNSKPEGAHTFDKTVTTTITGFNGAYTYTIPAFDIWTIGQNSYSSSTKGPVVYSTAQRAMIGHTVLVQQGTGWNNRTGTFSVTLNKPSNTSIEMYLMVR